MDSELFTCFKCGLKSFFPKEQLRGRIFCQRCGTKTDINLSQPTLEYPKLMEKLSSGLSGLRSGSADEELCNYCSTVIPVDTIKSHNDRCEMYPINCRICNGVFNRRLMNSHMKECALNLGCCKFFPIGCPFRGGNELEYKRHETNNIHAELMMNLLLDLQMEQSSNSSLVANKELLSNREPSSIQDRTSPGGGQDVTPQQNECCIKLRVLQYTMDQVIDKQEKEMNFCKQQILNLEKIQSSIKDMFDQQCKKMLDQHFNEMQILEKNVELITGELAKNTAIDRNHTDILFKKMEEDIAMERNETDRLFKNMEANIALVSSEIKSEFKQFMAKKLESMKEKMSEVTIKVEQFSKKIENVTREMGEKLSENEDNWAKTKQLVSGEIKTKVEQLSKKIDDIGSKNSALLDAMGVNLTKCEENCAKNMSLISAEIKTEVEKLSQKVADTESAMKVKQTECEENWAFNKIESLSLKVKELEKCCVQQSTTLKTLTKQQTEQCEKAKDYQETISTLILANNELTKAIECLDEIVGEQKQEVSSCKQQMVDHNFDIELKYNDEIAKLLAENAQLKVNYAEDKKVQNDKIEAVIQKQFCIKNDVTQFATRFKRLNAPIAYSNPLVLKAANWSGYLGHAAGIAARVMSCLTMAIIFWSAECCIDVYIYEVPIREDEFIDCIFLVVGLSSRALVSFHSRNGFGFLQLRQMWFEELLSRGATLWSYLLSAEKSAGSGSDPCLDEKLCSHCNSFVAGDKIQSHYDNCGMYPINCKFCKHMFSRREMKEHVQECARNLGVCKFFPIGCHFQSYLYTYLLFCWINKFKQKDVGERLSLGGISEGSDIHTSQTDCCIKMKVFQYTLDQVIEKQEKEINLYKQQFAELEKKQGLLREMFDQQTRTMQKVEKNLGFLTGEMANNTEELTQQQTEKSDILMTLMTTTDKLSAALGDHKKILNEKMDVVIRKQNNFREDYMKCKSKFSQCPVDRTHLLGWSKNRPTCPAYKAVSST
uniref:TRAF-type domain-containing protein n=1 Tax=Strigamia maritima TaxID=126957 RepID=T1IZU3_STRMM